MPLRSTSRGRLPDTHAFCQHRYTGNATNASSYVGYPRYTISDTKPQTAKGYIGINVCVIHYKLLYFRCNVRNRFCGDGRFWKHLQGIITQCNHIKLSCSVCNHVCRLVMVFCYASMHCFTDNIIRRFDKREICQ